MKKFIILVLLVLITAMPFVSIDAKSPYITQTVNRYDELVTTQDAYDAQAMYKTFGSYSLNKPVDMVFSEIANKEYLFILNQGSTNTSNPANSILPSVVILDEDLNYVTEFGSDSLIKPSGVYVRDNYVYVTDFGKNDDVNSGKIDIYNISNFNNITLEKTYGRPSGIVMEAGDFLYRPTKIAVDSNHTMYVISEGSINGVLLINSDNRFLNFFAPNNVGGTFWDLVMNFFYGNNDNVEGLTDNIPSSPSNVFLDDSGYIYTVTQTLTQNGIGDTLKKVNIGGLNFFNDGMQVSEKFIDSYASNHKTIYAISTDGFIYEYDLEGNLLFKFAGPMLDTEQLGLFHSSGAQAVAVNSKGELYALDMNQHAVIKFTPTQFTGNVHEALVLHTAGKYQEAKEIWEEVIRYNAMFDLAYEGIGMAYYLDGQYAEALEQFEIANAKDQYSEAFWEVRNIWLTTNMINIFIVVLVLVAAYVTVKLTNKKFAYLAPVSKLKQKIVTQEKISKSLKMTRFITNPMDACYEVRYDKGIKWYNGFIIIGIIVLIYIFHLIATGFIFNNVVLEQTILAKEVIKVIAPVFLFIFANYLISALMSGEGSFRCIFLGTIGSLLPIIILLPIAVVVSNILTYNESFIYNFILGVMIFWTVINLFVVIQETHRFNFKQTIANIFLTVIMIFIIIILMILFYMIIAQFFAFISDIFKEALFR